MDYNKVFFKVEDFTLTEKKLGNGNFGSVYIAKKKMVMTKPNMLQNLLIFLQMIIIMNKD